MVTGVEAAGLALAIFPIVVQGFACYLDGIRKIKEAKNYRGMLKRLARGLKMEKITFENTCEFFLEGMVTGEEMVVLVTGVGWDKLEFQSTLLGRLKPNEAEAFIAAVKALTEYLREFEKGLGLDQDDKNDKRFQRRQWEKLKLVLDQESHKGSLEEIRRINADLERLTMQRTRAPLQKPTPQSHVAREYNRIRSQAKSLHGVLQERFEAAPCRCKHSASLQLEDCRNQDSLRFKVFFNFAYVPTAAEATSPRQWRALEFQPVDFQENTSTSELSEPPKAEGNENNSDKETICPTPETSPPPKKDLQIVRDKLIEGYESLKESVKRTKNPKKARFSDEPPKHSQIQIQKASLSKVTNTLQRIKDLCIAITTSHADCCIGFLEDQPKGLWHHIWPPTTSPSSRYDLEPVPLDTLLIPGSIEQLDRLELGVKIASAMMKLHATEWLSESWGTKDIFFLHKPKLGRTTTGEIAQIIEPELGMPFVRRMLGSSPELHPLQHTEHTPEKPALMEFDKSLFSLGIVLMELWFEKPLKDLRIDQNQPSSENADYETAQQRIGYLFGEAGQDYGLAVSHCINGLKGRAVKGKSIKSFLDNDDFKNDVHENVVGLLQRNLELGVFEGIQLRLGAHGVFAE